MRILKNKEKKGLEEQQMGFLRPVAVCTLRHRMYNETIGENMGQLTQKSRGGYREMWKEMETPRGKDGG
jgi:hypothetical protein